MTDPLDQVPPAARRKLAALIAKLACPVPPGPARAAFQRCTMLQSGNRHRTAA